MLRSRSQSVAGVPERPRLAPPLLVLALTLGMAATLVLLYPHEDLVLRLAAAPEGPLSAAYLRALLKTEPDNPRLRLLVAGNLLRAHRYDEMRTTLEPALASPDPALRREALWLLWQADSAQAMQPAPAALARQRKARLRELTLALATLERDPQRLAQLAGQLLVMGEREQAMTLFRDLERQLPGRLLTHLEQAAALALARGDYAAAAEIHMAARREADTMAARRQYFLAALRDLESGNHVKEALELAERELGEFADDREVLLELVRLARAAQRPDRADAYVRRLLRMSLFQQWQRLAAGLDFQVRRVAADGPGVPFDDAVYTLAYTVFLENRKLEDAWRVAASAVRQAPDNLAWRRRLAQVSEWLSRSDQALEQWLFIARRSQDAQAWENVRRLGLGLLRDDAVEAYLRHRLATRFEVTLALELAAAQERQGKPEAALATLEEAWKRSRDARLAQAAAELSERMGELETAVGWWQRVLTEAPTPEQALRLATLQVLLGQEAAARQTLEAARDPQTAPASYWRLRAALASRAGDRAAARLALEQLARGPDAEAGDLNDLEWLLADDEPVEAARVALLRWQRFRDEAALLRALERFQAFARFDEAQTVFAGLDAATRQRLEQNPRYCLLAARQAWQRRDPDEARRLYARAERLAPEDAEVAEALLWFAIENADTAGIRRLLARHEHRLARLGRRDVRIAAHATLNEAALAWRLTAPELARHRDDPLWLITAADLLEQLDRHDEAWQLRRHALRRIGQVAPEARRFARARLAATLEPGDRARATLAAAVAESPERATPLLLAHWINAGEYSLARAWLYGRLAQAAARPRWAELAVALAEDDREALARLLAQPDDLPRRDAVEAARRLFEPEAASLAFTAQARLGTDDDLQAQLDELLPGGAGRTAVQWEALRFPAFDENQTTLGVQGAVLPRLRLALELTSIQRSLKDPAALGRVVDERRTTLTASGRRGEDAWQLSIGRREAFASRTPLSAAYRRRRGHWELALEAGHAQPAEESTPLRVAGEKDGLALTLTVEPVRPFAFSARAAASRYRAQTGTSLGRGRTWEVHASTWLRREDPDGFLDLFVSRHQYRPLTVDDAALASLLPAGSTAFDANFFLPRDFTLWGLTLSSRLAFLDTDTRALRPFWSLSLTRHSEEGFGYDALVGVAGSVFGADHLALGGQWARAQGTTPGSSRRLFLRYRLDF